MGAVAELGLAEARHLRGDIYEVRAAIGGQAFRVLYANEGKRGQILLALEAVSIQVGPPLSARGLVGWVGAG